MAAAPANSKADASILDERLSMSGSADAENRHFLYGHNRLLSVVSDTIRGSTKKAVWTAVDALLFLDSDRQTKRRTRQTETTRIEGFLDTF